MRYVYLSINLNPSAAQLKWQQCLRSRKRIRDAALSIIIHSFTFAP